MANEPLNYFELYELPVSFNPDQKLVKQKFYQLSKQFHPDFYINEGQEKQDEVLELSTVNNKAFQVLKDPQKRLHYILELKDQLVEGENYALPQSFLMEMMDVNEALMELEFGTDPEKLAELKNQTAEIEDALNKELTALASSFDNSGAAEQENVLKAIKDIYYRNKYLLRIRDSLNKFATNG
ncbi:Fe-S protein assembly co-chaperone HscB [Pedobacter frigiditerrae]|uniref:Fe-S protein assembly co-chaperone HscB n=1 Tax=Pedobacter frigiditerrae TaxID=2530452 RepID=A0A4R0MXS4_9SPHI|nr:Fe-S protein assembly co-chaperone HscB [Pedobacter frigiditerrae]TCC92050.1 Fe-S protein assembly co-chaperone HscB [Pedobacter frigiditerrae]